MKVKVVLVPMSAVNIVSSTITEILLVNSH